MSDTTQGETATDNPTTEAPAGTVLRVPVTKAKGGFVEINTAELPDDVYAEALALGVKELANRKMSKITKAQYPDADELKAAALAQAQKNVEDIKAGKIKFAGKSSATKVSGAEKTEAMRIARNLIKDTLKREKIKISHVKASEITAAAKVLLEQDPKIMEQAKANLAARDTIGTGSINIRALIHEDPALVAKAEAKAAKEKSGTLSAKQAGMTKKSKPGASATQH
jgi:hypothetical protein